MNHISEIYMYNVIIFKYILSEDAVRRQIHCEVNVTQVLMKTKRWSFPSLVFNWRLWWSVYHFSFTDFCFFVNPVESVAFLVLYEATWMTTITEFLKNNRHYSVCLEYKGNEFEASLFLIKIFLFLTLAETLLLKQRCKNHRSLFLHSGTVS